MRFQKIITVLFILSRLIATGQDSLDLLKEDSIQTDYNIVKFYDYNLALLYQDLCEKKEITKDSALSHSKEEIENRLRFLNAKTPFEFDYSEATTLHVQEYISKRVNFAQKMFDYSLYYFPYFESELIKNDLPLELKYLPIVESALNPIAKSRAGAVGLWQFMPLTAKMMNLTIDSYIDQRRDPILSTKAACLYLKKLYKLYKNWNLALAAYNAGPGNVNKAIRRSGGKKTYWEIRPYLPKETQHYIPTFTAVNYMMEYSFNKMNNSAPFLYHQVDTIQVSERIDFKIMEHWLSYDAEKLARLNPVYKLQIIPENSSKNTLCLPTFLIADFLMQQDSIYHYSKTSTVSNYTSANSTEPNYYTIKEGDTIWEIVQKHPGLSVAEIKKLNTNINVAKVKKGDKILINIQ